MPGTHQFLWRPLFGDNSPGKHHHFVRTAYCAHPVGNYKHGFVFYQPG